MPSRWKVLSGEFRRRPAALVKKFRKLDRVGRQGLFEPREDFSRLPTNHTARRFCLSIWRNHAVQIPWCGSIVRFRGSNSVAYPLACPAVGKFSRASSAGGRRHLLKNFANWIVSVAEDCLSPERTFHGCPQIFVRFRGSFPWLNCF